MEEVAIDAVAGERLIVYAAGGESASAVAEAVRAADVRLRGLSQVQLTEGIVALVRAGAGVSILADWAAAPYVADGSLAAVPIRGEAFARTWMAVTLADAADSTYTTAFAEMLAASPPVAARPVARPHLGRVASGVAAAAGAAEDA